MVYPPALLLWPVSSKEVCPLHVSPKSTTRFLQLLTQPGTESAWLSNLCFTWCHGLKIKSASDWLRIDVWSPSITPRGSDSAKQGEPGQLACFLGPLPPPPSAGSGWGRWAKHSLGGYQASPSLPPLHWAAATLEGDFPHPSGSQPGQSLPPAYVLSGPGKSGASFLPWGLTHGAFLATLRMRDKRTRLKS